MKVDEMIFNFKRKVHSWLKETNEDDRCSKSSSRTKSHSSRSSSRSSKSNISGSSKSDRIDSRDIEILGWCPAGSVLTHGEKVPL